MGACCTPPSVGQVSRVFIRNVLRPRSGGEPAAGTGTGNVSAFTPPSFHFRSHYASVVYSLHKNKGSECCLEEKYGNNNSRNENNKWKQSAGGDDIQNDLPEQWQISLAGPPVLVSLFFSSFPFFFSLTFFWLCRFVAFVLFLNRMWLSLSKRIASQDLVTRNIGWLSFCY